MPIASPKPSVVATPISAPIASPGPGPIVANFGVSFYGLASYGIGTVGAAIASPISDVSAAPGAVLTGIYGVSSYGQHFFGSASGASPMATPVG